MKALLIERNKNHENEIRIQILKSEYTEKVKTIASMQNETEQLIDLVAQGETQIDKKQEEFDYLFQKHLQDKAKLEQQAEKIQSYELSIVANKETEAIQAKEMEDRIDKRVKKILDQERDLMNQQKRINVEKLKNQEMKMNTLKQQLKDAKDELSKHKNDSPEMRDETFQNTLNKLVTSEKNLEELKVMYHNLNQAKEHMKKDLFVLDKKYKKA